MTLRDQLPSALIAALLTATFALPTGAQTSTRPAEATLRGVVSDSHRHPVADANVSLRPATGTHTWRAHTDASGAFTFSALPVGTYTIRAEVTDQGEAASTVSLAANETKTINLTLSETDLVFFDEPTFSVAGVTDTSNLGGHGSNTVVVRTRNALAKATASLSKDTGAVANAKAPATESALRDAQQRDPANFSANYELGRFLVESGRMGDAKPYLARSSQIETEDNSLPAPARADLHHLLGDVAEQTGDPLAAVREYKRAAELDASEANLFDWGAELLLHHAPEPAAEVFSNGNRRFPHSARMLIGLGVTWYVRDSYEEAERWLCAAADLAPDDPAPYVFLGKILRVESGVSEEVANRLAKLARSQPKNAMASYDYAVSLWRRRTSNDTNALATEVQAILERAIALDPQLGEAYLQLGIVHADREEFQQAIAAYQRAIQVNPRMEEAHYRLAQAYRLNGQTDKAQNELKLYQEISKEQATEVERDRTDIKQFVYTLRGQSSQPPQP